MKENFDIIIPVYNEGENIVSTINSLIKNVKYKINIFIIYDNDNDSTCPLSRIALDSIKTLSLLKMNF